MKKVYLDSASNTFLDKRVLNEMKPFLNDNFVGNSHSAHDYGYYAFGKIEEARQLIGDCLKVSPNEIIFTSGASEGNNFVIKGLAYRELIKKRKGKKHIVCGATEHNSILNPLKQLEKIGFSVSYVKPNSNGVVTANAIKECITEDTFLLCLMDVNNELGSQNEVFEATRYARELNIPSLVDCTQSFGYGKETLFVKERFPNADFCTFSAHKIYGPTGVGCVIALNGSRELLKECALVNAGAQEGGLRGGTANTAGIVGMAKAIDLISRTSYERLYNILYDYLLLLIKYDIGEDKIKVNVVPTHKNIISLNCSNYVQVDNLANSLSMYGVAVSAGSACDTDHDETEGDFNPSHVLVNLGLEEKDIRNTIRISFNKNTRTKDIKFFVKQLILLHEDINKMEEKND